MDESRQWLRHFLATLAYRGGKVVQGAPEGFGSTRACATCRSAAEVLSHINDLLDWTYHHLRGQSQWHESNPQAWEQDVERFFAGLRRLDEHLTSGSSLDCPVERLFQGPIADAFTHIGQLATLRRLADSPIRGENYYQAEVVIGRIGPEQSTKRVEFD